jgi:hypothetical protein
LLRVFKDYYPEIIVGEAVRGRASAFKVSFESLRRWSKLMTQSTLTPNGGKDWMKYKLLICKKHTTCSKNPGVGSRSRGMRAARFPRKEQYRQSARLMQLRWVFL